MNGLNLAYKTKKEIVNARLVAFGIDYFIWAVIFIIFLRFNDKLQYGAFNFFMMITSIIYFISLETFFGCTVGKFIMGLRIIDKNCNKPNLCEVLVRSILRFVTFIHPIMIIVWITEYIITYRSQSKQRLCDKMAGTLVVYAKELNTFRKNSTENSMSSEDFIIYNDLPKMKVFEDINGNDIVDAKKVIIEIDNNKLSVIGIEGFSVENIISEVDRGARFIVFYKCFSAFAYTKKIPSNVYFIRYGEKKFKYHKRSSLFTFLFGWWGIPWGPIWTISCLRTNFSGGIDMTQNVFEALKFGVNNKQKI